MSRNSALVLALTLGSLVVPAQAFAQLTPPAGSAGAGNSPIVKRHPELAPLRHEELPPPSGS
jgi:hypothetical protein